MLHPVHQRSFDHLERPLVLLRGLPRCLPRSSRSIPWTSAYESRSSTVRFPPREVLFLRDRAPPWTRLGERDEPLGRVRPTVEDHVLDVLQQVRRDVLVDVELARVHDRHIEPGRDRVVQERRMHRAADGLVPAERERQVRHAAAHLHAGAAPLDLAGRFDERLGELAVLLDAGGHREDVRVHDDARSGRSRLVRSAAGRSAPRCRPCGWTVSA